MSQREKRNMIFEMEKIELKEALEIGVDHEEELQLSDEGEVFVVHSSRESENELKEWVQAVLTTILQEDTSDSR